MTTAKSGKNGKSRAKKAPKRIAASETSTTRRSPRVVVYHPLSTPESREKWRKAIRTVLAREKSSEYKAK
jgi:hypothetical protein